MLISLRELGIDTAGDHPYRDGILQVREKHLKITREHPDVRFNVIGPTRIRGKAIYIIGTCSYEEDT